MVSITSLLLPILLSAVFVFIASSIIHMMTPWHKNDFKGVPDEERARAAIKPLGIAPGDYMIPRCNSMEEMKSPEFAKKMAEGPIVIMTVIPPGPMTMGGQFIGWFTFSIVISAVAGFLACAVVPMGATYKVVFHTVALAAFLGYSGALWPMQIWYKRNLGTTIRTTLDGLLFALITAGTFGWLWPK